MTRAWASEHGDPLAWDHQILRTVVGSSVHGIAISGTDDEDEMGVYVEPPHVALGYREPPGHFTARTQPDGARSGPGDVDLSLYSLRRYLRLVVAGNPTVLLPLFAPDVDVLHITDLGRALRRDGPRMLTRSAGHRFLGYLHGQRERMVGRGRQSRVPNRPELVARYGWDVKYGSHALRLAIQGLQVVTEGRLTLPLPDADRELVLAVKTGRYTLDETLALIDARAAHLQDALDAGQGPLPDRPAIDVNRWSAAAHLQHWETEGTA